MEALEGFRAEDIRQLNVRETVGHIRRQLGYDVEVLALVTPEFVSDTLPVDWLPATNLTTGAATWVPRELCELDLRVPANSRRVHLIRLTIYRLFEAGKSALTVLSAAMTGIAAGINWWMENMA